MEPPSLDRILEAALLAAEQPLPVERLLALFAEDERPGREEVRAALARLGEACAERAVELVEVAGGYRYQVRREFAPHIARLWEERPPRYSRALLETLALIAYRQPITRGEIEEIRGVGVSSSIVKTLQERDWIRVVGHREVPGRPAMYGTTRRFLDDFNLKGLDELPTLAELRDLSRVNVELPFDAVEPEPDGDAAPAEADGEAPTDAAAGAVEPDAGAPAQDAGTPDARVPALADAEPE